MEVLPIELVRECLLRVPYKAHAKLKAVCKTWNAMVSSPTFYTDRKLHGTSQQLIACTMLINRYHFEGLARVYEINVYDPLKGTSERLSPLHDPHCPRITLCYHCVAVNRKLVLIGRVHPSSSSLVNTVYIYDFESARWRHGADMPTP